MNPNRVSRELRKLPGNIRSPHLPGGTLVSAVLDRQLMAWSDRGGASRIFGEIWSEHCWAILNNGTSIFSDTDPDQNGAQIIRLDDNPRIAVQAGRNQLPNPDFLILQPENGGTVSIRAVDAKFAVDHLRRTQVSPESIRELIEMPDSLARQEVERTSILESIEALNYEPGIFLGPRSLLNDYFFQRLTTGDPPEIPDSELRLLTVESRDLFSGIEEYPLMTLLQEIDGLRSNTPATELVLGMYYLRLASAARWFSNQSHLPLLSIEAPDAIPVEEVYALTERRIEAGESAFGLIETWSASTDKQIAKQKQVQDAARLPVRMSEIRQLIGRRGVGEDRKLIRRVRGILEQEFIRNLIEITGPIPANPPIALESVIHQVATASKSLRQHMLRETERIVEHVTSQENTLEDRPRDQKV